MKFGYYPGCTLKNKAKELDEYARACAEKLGVELIEQEKWQCCGGVYISSRDETACKLPSVRTLINARKSGMPLVTVCAACHNTIKQTAYALEHDKEFAQKVNAYFSQERNGMSYEGETKIYHYLEMLRDVIGFENVKKAVVKPLNRKVGAYYGCLLLRPSAIMQTDDAENPSIIEELIEALGGTPVKFAMRNECCGGYTVLENAKRTAERSGEILDNARLSGAECVITACPLCKYNLDKSGKELSVYYFTELMAEALGIKEISYDE